MSYVSLLLLGLMDNIRGPFYPDILKDLALNGTKGSLFFAVASFSALGGNFLGSFLLRKISAHGLMNYSLAGLGLGFFLIGRTTGFDQLVPACIFFGAHFGLLNVSQNVVVQQNASAAYRRRIFNGLHAMYGMAALGAPLLALGFLGFGWNWGMSFSLIGFVSALVGLGFLIVTWSWKEAHLVSEDHHDDQPFHARTAFAMAAALAFYMVGELTLSTRLPLWLREVYGFTPQAANFYLAVFSGSLFLGRVLFTFVSFHQISNRMILSLSAFTACILFGVGLGAHPLIASISGFFMGPFFPVVMDEMSKRFSKQAGQVIGWGITLGSVLIVAMHFSLGVLTDLYGIETALWIGPGALVCAFILIQRATKKIQSS